MFESLNHFLLRIVLTTYTVLISAAVPLDTHPDHVKLKH